MKYTYAILILFVCASCKNSRNFREERDVLYLNDNNQVWVASMDKNMTMSRRLLSNNVINIPAYEDGIVTYQVARNIDNNMEYIIQYKFNLNNIDNVHYDTLFKRPIQANEINNDIVIDTLRDNDGAILDYGIVKLIKL